jgi:hypothetical protein
LKRPAPGIKVKTRLREYWRELKKRGRRVNCFAERLVENGVYSLCPLEFSQKTAGETP